MLVRKEKNMVLAALLMLTFVILIRTAWISDDAAITLRTVLNFINGYGPTFNVDERVQAYTHPLWFLLLSGFSWLSGNVFYTNIALSIFISLAVICMFFAVFPRDLKGALLGTSILIFSKSFTDFSTSGLENPLSHILILTVFAFAVKAFEAPQKRYLFGVLLSAAFLYLSRPDLLLLICPIVILVFARYRQQPRVVLSAALIGAIPVVLWSGFSLYYYGFPFPNTAYAKLGTGIPLLERIAQGLFYLFDSLDRDPLTLAAIFAGLLIGFRSSAFNRGLAAGTALYLAYVVSIGGDFMSGRFLTAPLLTSALIIATHIFPKFEYKVMAAAVSIFVGIGLKSTLFSDSTYNQRSISQRGIADERGFWLQNYGLLTSPRELFANKQWVVNHKSVAVTCGGLGFASISAGPGRHFIDDCALADPLLARLPARYSPDWRIGHFNRQLPANYLASVEKQENLLSDPITKEFYDSILKITRGELNAPGRWAEILRLNLGKTKSPNWDLYRFGPVLDEPSVKVGLDRLDRQVIDGAWDAPGNVQFPLALEVRFKEPISIDLLDISVDSNDVYFVGGFAKDHYVHFFEISSQLGRIGMHRVVKRLDKPSPAIDRIVIKAIEGDGRYSLGHLKLGTSVRPGNS